MTVIDEEVVRGSIEELRQIVHVVEGLHFLTQDGIDRFVFRIEDLAFGKGLFLLVGTLDQPMYERYTDFALPQSSKI